MGPKTQPSDCKACLFTYFALNRNLKYRDIIIKVGVLGEERRAEYKKRKRQTGLEGRAVFSSAGPLGEPGVQRPPLPPELSSVWTWGDGGTPCREDTER